MGRWEFSVYFKQDCIHNMHALLYIKERKGRERGIKGNENSGKELTGQEGNGKVNGGKERKGKESVERN